MTIFYFIPNLQFYFKVSINTTNSFDNHFSFSGYLIYLVVNILRNNVLTCNNNQQTIFVYDLLRKSLWFGEL